MSQENVELHRRAIEAFNSHDVEAFIALCDPSIEAHSVFAAVGGAVYHGHDGRGGSLETRGTHGEMGSASSLRRTTTSARARSRSLCCTATEGRAVRRSRCRSPRW